MSDSNLIRFAKGFVSLVSLGLPLLLAATGALGVKASGEDATNGAQLVFMGIYMIVFAGTLFFYELLQICPIASADLAMKKNFGFLYGPIGRGCYTLLIGIFSFGLVAPRNLAVATGVVLGFWGCVIILISLFVKDFFPPPVKLVL